MKKLSLIFVVPLLLFSCEEQTIEKEDYDVQASVMKDVAEAFELSIRETVLIKPEALTITFTDVVEDSRCPLNVNCVWAGRVSVQLEVKHQNHELAILLTLGDDDQNSSTYKLDGIQITLLEVIPYPEYPENIDPEDYTIKLIVNKI